MSGAIKLLQLGFYSMSIWEGKAYHGITACPAAAVLAVVWWTLVEAWARNTGLGNSCGRGEGAGKEEAGCQDGGEE